MFKFDPDDKPFFIADSLIWLGLLVPLFTCLMVYGGSSYAVLLLTSTPLALGCLLLVLLGVGARIFICKSRELDQDMAAMNADAPYNWDEIGRNAEKGKEPEGSRPRHYDDLPGS